MFRSSPTGTLLASVVQKHDVPADANFFDDLGADSMLMARFCARVRKQADLPSVSIKDVYQHPTITDSGRGPLRRPTADRLQSCRSPPKVLADVLGADTGLARRPLLRRPGRGLDAHGPLLRRVAADRPAVGLDQGRLPAPDDHGPGRDGLRTARRNALEEGTRRGAGRGRWGRMNGRVARRPLLRRPGRGLDAHGPLLRSGPQNYDLPSVSIKDVYENPTITGGHVVRGRRYRWRRALRCLPDPRPRDGTQAAPLPNWMVPSGAHGGRQRPPHGRARPSRRVRGAQLLLFLGYSPSPQRSSSWAPVDLRQREPDRWLPAGRGCGAAVFFTMSTLPIPAKWVLVGRWTPRQIRVWSLDYVRFWLVKTLVAANPLVLFAGSPIYPLYLRALGAKVGRGVVILSRHVPVCADLLTVGDGTVVEKDAFLNCYRVVGQVVQTGPVQLGRHVFVGEKAVLDIGTSLGDGAQLGHASSLHAGQAVPAGERWHGSPGQPTDADYQGVAPARCPPWRGARYSLLQLVFLLGVTLPVTYGGFVMLFVEVPWLAMLIGTEPTALTSPSFYEVVLVASLVLFVGGTLVSLLVATTVPRLLNLALRPDEVYPLYGIQYAFHRLITRHDQPEVLPRALRRQLLHRPATCSASDTGCPPWCRPGRTSAPRSSTTTRT